MTRRNRACSDLVALWNSSIESVPCMLELYSSPLEVCKAPSCSLTNSSGYMVYLHHVQNRFPSGPNFCSYLQIGDTETCSTGSTSQDSQRLNQQSRILYRSDLAPKLVRYGCIDWLCCETTNSVNGTLSNSLPYLWTLFLLLDCVISLDMTESA